jgi:hypothetical protein
MLNSTAIIIGTRLHSKGGRYQSEFACYKQAPFSFDREWLDKDGHETELVRNKPISFEAQAEGWSHLVLDFDRCFTDLFLSNWLNAY